jgi:hypothetical protein
LGVGLEGVCEFSESGGLHGVVAPFAAWFSFDDPGFEEGFEVVTDGGLAEGKVPFDVHYTDRFAGPGEEMEDGDPVGITECFEPGGQVLAGLVVDRLFLQGGTAGAVAAALTADLSLI